MSREIVATSISWLRNIFYLKINIFSKILFLEMILHFNVCLFFQIWNSLVRFWVIVIYILNSFTWFYYYHKLSLRSFLLYRLNKYDSRNCEALLFISLPYINRYIFLIFTLIKTKKWVEQCVHGHISLVKMEMKLLK